MLTTRKESGDKSGFGYSDSTPQHTTYAKKWPCERQRELKSS